MGEAPSENRVQAHGQPIIEVENCEVPMVFAVVAALARVVDGEDQPHGAYL